MTYTLTLTEHEANLVERALRAATATVAGHKGEEISRLLPGTSRTERLSLVALADRLLRDIINAPPHPVDVLKDAMARQQIEMVPQIEAALREICDEPVTTVCTGTMARQSDEYACSCGTRWDAADGEVHP